MIQEGEAQIREVKPDAERFAIERKTQGIKSHE
jgi:hypothetical protein